jgi:predicted small lipoprotein YifL
MKTTRILTLALALTLTLALAACGLIGAPSGTPPSDSGGSPGDTSPDSTRPGSPGTNDPTSPSGDQPGTPGSPGTDAPAIPDAPPGTQGSSELMFGFGPEEFNGNVFVLIDNLTKK